MNARKPFLKTRSSGAVWSGLTKTTFKVSENGVLDSTFIMLFSTVSITFYSSGSPKTRKGATSAGVKSAVPGVRANSPRHQSKQDPTLTSSLEEHMTKEVKHKEEEDIDGTIDKGETIKCTVRGPSEEHVQVDTSSQSNLRQHTTDDR